VVSTGSDVDCTCQGRSVEDRRFTDAEWTFDVVDGGGVSLFGDKPKIDGPCPLTAAKTCPSEYVGDAEERTATAGKVPAKVRITVNKHDDWCMKTFCISSKVLGKKWVATATNAEGLGQAQWMNPGVAKDGDCKPNTVQSPNNNWGWCRFISKGKASDKDSCNTYNDWGTASHYDKAFWEYELEEQDGECPEADDSVREDQTPTQPAAPITIAQSLGKSDLGTMTLGPWELK
jgi:hypothetical protein